MEEDFYQVRLRERYGLEVLVPDLRDRKIVHRVIYDELCLGRIDAESRSEYLRIMAELIVQGAQGIILGCTEISLLVGPQDSAVPLFDTTSIHARQAAEWALAAT
jgi:aspartate racemase